MLSTSNLLTKKILPNDLPNLIFAEYHEDPILSRILIRLLPLLKELQYRTFFDESISTLDAAISGKEEWIKMYKEIKSQFESHGLNVKNDNDQEIFWSNDYLDISRLKSLNFDDNEWDVVVFQLVKTFCLARHKSDKLWVEFYKLLKLNQFNYEGIDFEGKFKDVDSPEREKSMASHYLKHKKGVFGMIGYAHASPLQRELLKNSSPEDISRFKFFYIYSSPNYLNLIKTFPDDSHFTKDLPMGITYINAENKSLDDVVSAILESIKENEISIENKQLLK